LSERDVDFRRATRDYFDNVVEESPRRPFQLDTAKGLSQLAFSAFENTLLSLRQIFAGAIDVKVQH
jgi:hypothetical protein